MDRLRSRARRHGLDLAVVLVALGSLLEVVLRDDPLGAPRTPLWLAAPAVALVVLPLLARRRLPFAAPAAVWLLAAALSFADGRLVVFAFGLYVAGIGAAVLLGTLREARQARIGLAIVASGAAIVVYNDPSHTPGQFLFVPGLFALAWLAGLALGVRGARAEAAEQRASTAEREREAAARVAVAEERARIARELHDVVAHAVSVMVLTVGAVRHRLPGTLGEDADALRGAEQTGRAALAEMRRLLGAMHDDGQDADLGPQPGLDGLDALAERVRRAGLPVRLRVDGDAVPLPHAVELSAYRIVQEGLTNALKHAAAAHADVTVRYAEDALRLEVRDDGLGPGTADGRGRGLVGLRERVKIYGGEMTAGPGPHGGFVLTARLPLDGPPP